MLNPPETTVQEAIEKLHGLLNAIPSLTISEIDKPKEVDGLLQVQHGGNKWCLLLEVKSKIQQLRDARHAIRQLRRNEQALETDEFIYPVFASKYLSPSIRKLCVDNDIGYLDFFGNCRLVFGQIFIEKEVPASQTPEPKRLKHLFSLKSSRVIRRLLQNPEHKWRVQSLAGESSVSIATVSLVKNKLLGEEYAKYKGEAFIISKPLELLQEWSLHYKSRQHNQIEFYGNAELTELENRFSKHCRKHSIDYAFTMFSGARRIAPFTRGVQRAYAYVSSKINLLELAEALDLKKVESGGNFRLIAPDDDDIMWAKQKVDGDFVASDIQLYLDLIGHPGRGEENADYILEHRIKQQW